MSASLVMAFAVVTFGAIYFMASPSQEAVDRAISRSGAHKGHDDAKKAPLCAKNENEVVLSAFFSMFFPFLSLRKSHQKKTNLLHLKKKPSKE